MQLTGPGGVSVDCRWHIGRELQVLDRCIVNHCFAEIVAVPLPTGDMK